MAAEAEVKKYLAYWFQLGKRVVLKNGQQTLTPRPIYTGQDYSNEFKAVWQQIIDPKNGYSYLEGTEETIQELLSPAWEVSSCARCTMPVPISVASQPSLVCPCNDLNSWPNTELPLPRSPIDTQDRLQQIRRRLGKI
ncbi:hypothetical protein C7H19_09415 [Aphanothece hegewaldii CCALA 016]|uniref:Uncharacterized protein n=1 Tax=Aphanothece hegewaldii CCALA 016 TaxID=2107694 RepID=A0A2T1LZB3_9CHRO|nr:hypothetical protein [Aphanothece hegewaldii]PSF37755.1 hypothetical protein C7H19_09415 [Aphanothece hegewaldii CCALA 016]